MNSLCKAYNRDRILTDVSFSVFSGEIVSIIGHNGVGKTVLGKILGGELEEDAGEVWFEGCRVLPGKERGSRMYYIPEEGKILENLTVAENLFIGQEKKKNCYLKTASVFQAAEEYLNRYQIQVNPESRGRELSEAKRRMLLLLRQIVCPPKLLIVDGIMDLISPGGSGNSSPDAEGSGFRRHRHSLSDLRPADGDGAVLQDFADAGRTYPV